MDRRVDLFEQRNTTIFNSPLEVGLRIIFLLNEFYPRTADINRLIIYDYMMIHSSDAGGPKSVHPSIPHRASQILVKGAIMREALILMQSKELVEAVFVDTGISYKATELTKFFIEKLESTYAQELKAVSKWVKERFLFMDEESLNNYVRNNIENWGGEFILESIFRGGIYE